ncbi:hypothetical protein AB6A40_004281 [Gnathostoma spinigerum]|uniref:Uncharacterized protein n=1 Tax=Gnathostoma spinigerum TaxID=75299 RepID=A0ABD6ELY0_9BILA
MSALLWSHILLWYLPTIVIFLTYAVNVTGETRAAIKGFARILMAFYSTCDVAILVWKHKPFRSQMLYLLTFGKRSTSTEVNQTNKRYEPFFVKRASCITQNIRLTNISD